MEENAQQQVTAHVVSHTHWDREWRWPVWQTRTRLVEMLDNLLDLLEREPRYRHFTLDGQVVPITDYLEMRPENRERIEKLVRAGRLAIGPWFTLPDLWPVDGECLVRNLLIGSRIAKQHGGCLKIGYTTFGWGQTAQFAQIYAGFGIETIITAKNVSLARAPEAEFLWRAPDGTTVFTTRLGDLGRANFYKRGVLEIMRGARFWTREWEFDWSQAGLMTHRADEEGFHHDYTERLPEPGFHPERLEEALERTWITTTDTLATQDRFFGDGCDYTGGLENLPKIIDAANALPGNRKLKHSSLEEYVAAVRAAVDMKQLRVVEGELRDPPVTATQGGALATRLYLKQLNRRAQNRLIWMAEPMLACAAALGVPVPRKFLEQAWRYLLLCHSHDAINGVTVDKISEDVVYRLNQVLELADVMADQALTAMMERMDLSGHKPGEVLLVVFNSLPRPRREVVRVSLDTPREQEVERYTIVDAQGQARPVQWIDRRDVLAPVHESRSRPRAFYADRHSFFLDTGELPACGYRVFKLVREAKLDRTMPFLYERIDQGSQLCAGGWGMENEFLKVVMNGDGSFNLTDKERGVAYPNMNVFEDGGELGEYWHRTVPAHDEVVLSRGCAARIAVKRDGPLVTTIGAEIPLSVPAKGDWVRGGRSAERIPLVIQCEITLRAGERKVECHVRFENRAEDHRLRVLFPTGIAATHSDAAGHFIVDRRPVELERDDAGRGPGGMKTLPMQGFVDVSDGTRGMGFINDGLTEFEVSQDATRTVALTLLRTAPMMICTEWRTPTRFEHEKGGQCLGRREMRYALYPHAGNWAEADVFGETERFNLPLRMMQTAPHGGDQPEAQSFIEIAPAAVRLSAWKPAEEGDGWMLRLYNPTTEPVTATVRLRRPVTRVARTTMEEIEIEQEAPAGARGTELTMALAPGRVETYRLEF